MAKKPVVTDVEDVVENDATVSDDLEDLESGDKKDKKKKKEKKPKKEKEKREKKKGGFPVVPVILLLVIVGGVVAAFILNLFGIKDTVTSYLREAPLIGQFFPEPPEEPAEDENRFASMTPEEIMAEFTALEYDKESLQEQLTEAGAQKQTDDETIDYLRGFEEQIEEYRDVKNRFDQMVVEGGTPEAYAAFFENISPENAERLYQESLADTQYNADIAEQSATFAEMDPQTAADSLETMLGPNQDLVMALLLEMAIEDRAAIFDEMEPALIARINNLLEPAVPEDIPPATAPPLPEGVPEQTAAPEQVEAAAP